MDLLIRLNILKDAGQLSEVNYDKIISVIEYFKIGQDIELKEANAAMFITHLSSALYRIDKNELVNKIEETIWEEIIKDINYKKTIEITNDIENIVGVFPKSERDFIEMHICTLLSL